MFTYTLAIVIGIPLALIISGKVIEFLETYA